LCVAFKGAIAHWGFIHVDRDGGDSGTLIHVGVRTNSSGTTLKFENKLKVSPIRSMSQSSIVATYPIHGAVVTRQEALDILQRVYERNGDYQALLNNCQHFCIHGVEELKATICPGISDQTIKDLKKKTALVTRWSIWVNGQLQGAKK
jgi:hypothetical protein